MIVDQSAYAKGIYVLRLWASAGGSDGSVIIQNFKNTYGDAIIESIGKRTGGINFSVLTTAFIDAIDSGANKLKPTMADINTPLLRISGQGPTVLGALGDVSRDIVSDGLEITGDVVSFAWNTTKLLPLLLIALIGLAAYLELKKGTLSNVAKAGLFGAK